MPNLSAITAVVAAILITLGRIGRRTRLAVLGYIVLALAAVLFLLGLTAQAVAA